MNGACLHSGEQNVGRERPALLLRKLHRPGQPFHGGAGGGPHRARQPISPWLLPLFLLILAVKCLHVFLKCMAQRKEILAVSGFRETVSLREVRRNRPGDASKTSEQGGV